MLGTILIGLIVWFVASIPVGMVIGRALARSKMTLEPVPFEYAKTTRFSAPHSGRLSERAGYVTMITRHSGD